MSQAEVDALKAELAEKIKQYEGKLATLTVINGALKTENEQLQEQLDEERPDAEEEIEELKEEFAERLTQSDKQVASLKEEIQKLRGRLSQASQGSGVSEALLLEKDEAVEAYKAEGEALMRKVNELEGVIKRVRREGREAEAAWDQERRTLQGRQAQAQAQIQQLEEEILDQRGQTNTLQAHLEKLTQQYEEKLAAAKVDSQAAVDLEKADKAHSEAQEAARQREESMAATIHSLQESLSSSERSHTSQLENLHQEIRRLEERCREAECGREELATRSVEASVPLLRQVEAMTMHTQKQLAAAAQVEAALNARLQAALAEVAQAKESERMWKSKSQTTQATAEVLKENAAAGAARLNEAQSRLDAEQERCSGLERDLHRSQKREEELQCKEAEVVQQLKEAEAHLGSLKSRLQTVTLRMEEVEAERDAAVAKSFAPAPAPAPASAPSPSGPGPQDQEPEMRDRPATNGPDAPMEDTEDDIVRALLEDGEGPVGHSLLGHLTEGAQETTKHRRLNGELLELRRQLAYEKKARSHDAQALITAMEESHKNMELARENPLLHEKIRLSEDKLATCLEILGERNERVEQLEMDIGEMRSVYKEQITILADQVALLSSHLDRNSRNEHK